MHALSTKMQNNIKQFDMASKRNLKRNLEDGQSNTLRYNELRSRFSFLASGVPYAVRKVM